jgi:hypothetical protein
MDLLLKTITPALSAIQTGTAAEECRNDDQHGGYAAGVRLGLTI